MKLKALTVRLLLASVLLLSVHAREPKTHKLSVRVKTLELTAAVIVGKRYELQSSSDLRTWSRVQPPFAASSSTFTYDVSAQGSSSYYRLVELPPEYAPSSLVGLSYLLSSTSPESTIEFTSFSSYRILRGGSVVETGTYAPTRNDNVYTVAITPSLYPANFRTLQLTFTSAQSGSYTSLLAGGLLETGSFTSVGGYAPISLHGRVIRFIIATGPFEGSNFVEVYTGATSGTFVIVAGSEGGGTFVYTPGQNTATFVRTYTSPPQAAADGDQDNFILTFTSSTAGTLSGSQKTGNVEHDGVTGTFQFEN